MDDARKIRPDTVRLLIIDGEAWRVFEHTPDLDRRSSPTLVFESESAMRRVRDYPADWHEWDDAALYALSWQK